MSNEYYSGKEASDSLIEINGVMHELRDGLYYAVEDDSDDQAYESQNDQLAYEPRKSVDEAKNNRRPSLTKPTKVVLGGLVVGMFVIPPAVHVGTEQITNYFVNLASPTEDKILTQDELMNDLGKSFEELGPKTIGKIIEGMR
jgi:hypothetical protein